MEYRLALSGKKQVSKYFSAIIGADLNVRKLLGEEGHLGDTHSLGVEIKLSE